MHKLLKQWLILQEKYGDSAEESTFLHATRTDLAVFFGIAMSAFRTTVLFGIISGVQREAAFSTNDIQIFFEKDHGRTTEVCHCRDEDRLSSRSERCESGAGDQLLDLEAGDGVQRIGAGIGFLPCCFVVVVSRMTVLSGKYTEKYPQFLACGKKVYVLRFMLAVSVTISTKKNIFLCNAFGCHRVINSCRNFVNFEQNFSTVLSEMK